VISTCVRIFATRDWQSCEERQKKTESIMQEEDQPQQRWQKHFASPCTTVDARQHLQQSTQTGEAIWLRGERYCKTALPLSLNANDVGRAVYGRRTGAPLLHLQHAPVAPCFTSGVHRWPLLHLRHAQQVAAQEEEEKRSDFRRRRRRRRRRRPRTRVTYGGAAPHHLWLCSTPPHWGLASSLLLRLIGDRGPLDPLAPGLSPLKMEGAGEGCRGGGGAPTDLPATPNWGLASLAALRQLGDLGLLDPVGACPPAAEDGGTDGGLRGGSGDRWTRSAPPIAPHRGLASPRQPRSAPCLILASWRSSN
jgi:hypothetical protein